ncbi:MAG: hypothetical protein V4615_15620 [Bacteroidota bacterium]
MSDLEIAHLKSEVERLNKIITVLLEQSEAQRARIALAKKGNTFPDDEIATTGKMNGNTDNSIAITEKWNGNTNVSRPVPEIGNGNTESSIATAETDNGNANVRRPVSENGKGNTKGWINLSEIGKGNPSELPPLPAFLPLNHDNILRLHVLLKKEGFNKVRNEAVKNAARLMLHFYNKGGGAYPELMKLTGLSRFGLGKYIRSLKKRGLIERSGWQQFRVTAQGVGLMKLARCEGEHP